MDVREINSYGQKMIEYLELKTSPVAVKLISKKGEIPSGIKKVDEVMTHCQFVDRVRTTGEEFYTLAEDQMCKIGSGALGFNEIPPEVLSGESYYKGFKLFSAQGSASRTVKKIPVLPPNSTDAIIYSPLEKTSFVPDVIVVICNPKKAMLLTQAYVYKTGSRLETSFVGMQSLCSEGVVQTYKEGKVGIGLGCVGSRNNTSIEDEEMIMGISVEFLADVVSGLKENSDRGKEGIRRVFGESTLDFHLSTLQNANLINLKEGSVRLNEHDGDSFKDKIEDNIEKIVNLSQAKPVEITEIRKLMPCIVDPSRLRIIANMTPPLGETLKVLEPLFPRSRYVDRTRSLIIEKEEIVIIVYSSGKVSIGMIKNETEAREVLEELRIIINEAIKRGVVPVPREKVRVELREIYKYLPQTDCGKCGEQNCYSFVVRLMAGKITLDKCAPLKEPKYIVNKEHLQVLTTYT
ncbi:MAG TPA: DUF169 domain-containing protein [Methanosarcina sp.]|nr:DUF169 domain-containing protein [Methanosarcina sp.]